MNSPASVTIATYNYLNPFHGVKWKEAAALTDEAKQTSHDTLKASTQAKDDRAWEKYSNWPDRCASVAENLQLADIICVQEASKQTVQDLLSLIADKGYRLAIQTFHRSTNPKEEFGNAIFYNSEKITLINSFEAAHTPSDGWNRQAACANFSVSDKVFKVASVHPSGYYPGETDTNKKQASKIKGYQELEDYVRQLESQQTAADYLVIGGDFNEDPSESSFDKYRLGYLQKNGYICDTNLTVTEPLKNRRIDWLCFKGVQASQLHSAALEAKQKPASDHLLTGTTVQF